MEVTEAFLSVLDGKFTPLDDKSAAFSAMERFVPVLYDNDSSASKVNATRRHLFTKKGRPLESIPPTQVCRLDVEYEFFYDSGSTLLYQSNSSFLALILLSKRPFYITLIEQRTKRASRWSQRTSRKFLLRTDLAGRWEITPGNRFGQDYRKRLKPVVNFWRVGVRLNVQALVAND